jgi:hypothetical protein
MVQPSDRERALREILYPELAGTPPQELELSPTWDDLQRFADLLLAEPEEEALQRFLARRPGFLIGEAGMSDSSTLAFITKPAVGTRFVADFAVLHASQGGCTTRLYEIERASARLFTKSLTPARTYQTAIGQVTKWRQWIDANSRTFATDMLELAKSQPKWPLRAANGSFRLRSKRELDGLWQMFGGQQHPFFSYTIVCGRWANLTPEERRTLVHLNGSNNGNWYSTVTYDQVARNAYRRPLISFEMEWGPDAPND